MNRKPFSAQISVLLDEYKSVAEVARLCNSSEGTVRKWRDGKSEPGLGNLIALSDATGKSIEWLATGRSDNAYIGGVREPQARYNASKIQEVLDDSIFPEDAIAEDSSELILDIALERGLFTRQVCRAIHDFIDIYNQTESERFSTTPLEAVLQKVLVQADYALQSFQGDIDNLDGQQKVVLQNMKLEQEKKIAAIEAELKELRGPSLFDLDEFKNQ